jgi:hypothetical protein
MAVWREMYVNGSKIDQYNNLVRGVVPKPLGQIVTAFYYFCVLLDIGCLVATAMYPNGVARYVCAIRSMGAIAWPLFSEDLLHYSAVQCLGAMEEPSTSIILLSIKFSLGMLIIPVVCTVVACRPQGLLTLIEVSFLRAETSKAYHAELRRWGYRLVVILAIDVVGVLLCSYFKVADFNTSIVHQLSLEDGFAVIIPATVFYSLIFLVAVAISESARRKSSSKENGLS